MYLDTYIHIHINIYVYISLSNHIYIYGWNLIRGPWCIYVYIYIGGNRLQEGFSSILYNN